MTVGLGEAVATKLVALGCVVYGAVSDALSSAAVDSAASNPEGH
jgi:hypothetical protein